MNDDIEIPKSSSFLEAKRNESKNRFSLVLDEFKKLLNDKTHPDNQTQSYHNNVKSVLSRLLSNADELDKVNPGEGLFGLIIMSLRSSLRLKDDLVRMEVKIKELEREVKRLRGQTK